MDSLYPFRVRPTVCCGGGARQSRRSAERTPAATRTSVAMGTSRWVNEHSYRTGHEESVLPMATMVKRRDLWTHAPHTSISRTPSFCEYPNSIGSESVSTGCDGGLPRDATRSDRAPSPHRSGRHCRGRRPARWRSCARPRRSGPAHLRRPRGPCIAPSVRSDARSGRVIGRRRRGTGAHTPRRFRRERPECGFSSSKA